MRLACIPALRQVCQVGSCFCIDACALRLILQNPIKQLLVFHLPCRNGKSDARNLGVGGTKLNAVGFKEGEKNIHSNSLVSVYKGVIGDQRKADACALFLLRRIKFLTVKGRKCRFERAIQERNISYVRVAPVSSVISLCNKSTFS